jgi:hypothetical protein
MTVLDPVALGWHSGRPCGDCGALVFDVAREIREVDGEAGQVTRTPVVTCQCPHYYDHIRRWRPRGLEILGTFDTATGELELFAAPILASEMDPAEDPAAAYPDAVDACPGPWHPENGPLIAGVLAYRDWDGDDRKAITARAAHDIAADVVAIDRPPPVGTSARPPLAGRALWAKRPDHVPVECPKGVPHDALGWGFEGDAAWRPLRSAKEAGVVVLPPPKSRSRKPSPPPLMESLA